jgi:hypothetical protein
MKQSLLLSVLLICFCCSRPVPELTDFDQQTWKDDYKGCKGVRGPLAESLHEQRDKLKGLSESDLVTLLGKPDRNDLSEHHEKFYYYFIEPGQGCSGIDSVGKKLIVRFNATGVSKEVAIE